MNFLIAKNIKDFLMINKYDCFTKTNSKFFCFLIIEVCLYNFENVIVEFIPYSFIFKL